MFDNLVVTDHAKTAQLETVRYLQSLGYSCIMEYPVPNRGDGRTGRIDIIATNEYESIAIEFDNKTPRKKSLFKLRHSDFDRKIVLLRKNDGIKYKKGDIDVISVKTIV